MNDDMLALARNYQSEIATRIGWDNVTFHKGMIQDLALDLDCLEEHLQDQPVTGANDWMRAQAAATKLASEHPMIDDESVDVIVSNCVLNLVDPIARQQLFQEMNRVLKRGGRAVISDIVCDEQPPAHLVNDPELWSGCISGAELEDQFLNAFEDAGFYGIEIVERQKEAWAVVEGIEFRSLTVRAFKGKEGPCLDHHQAVIYKGPWKSVEDDDGHILRRGERMAVCQKTFDIYSNPPYQEQIIPVEPEQEVQAADATPFDCHNGAVRAPSETKGQDYEKTELPIADCCGNGGCC